MDNNAGDYNFFNEHGIDMPMENNLGDPMNFDDPYQEQRIGDH